MQKRIEEKITKIENEKGMVMVEAIYVVVIAVLVIFFTINAGVVFYNRIVLTSIANETASGVSEVYGDRSKEPFYNYTEYSHFKGRNVYRYFIGKKELDTIAESKALWYGSYLMHEKEFRKEENLDFSDINVECSENALDMQVLTVTIKRTYPVFIIDPVSFWGLEPEYEVKASGSAVCYDVIHQINRTAFKNEMASKLDGASSILGIINDIVKTVGKAAEHISSK